MNEKNKWKIRASLHDDISNGHIWATTGDRFVRRQVVYLKNEKGKKTYCEILSINENFRDKYNSSDRTIEIDANEQVLVMSEWYRDKLGVNINEDESVEIKKAWPFIGKIKACLHHPQIVVRIATWLGGISVVLGGISVWPDLYRFFVFIWSSLTSLMAGIIH